MDDLISQQIEQLKQKQLVLESQLYDGRTTGAEPCADLVDYHQVQEIFPNSSTKEVNRDPFSNSQASVAQFSGTKSMSLHERLKELQHLKHQHQSNARQALQKYFSVVNNYPDYQKRREEHLKIKPFSFFSRELLKPTRIHDSRMLEERYQKEEELNKILHTSFQVNPVPSTTFMNKYDLMVKEWCERKLAVERLAGERAERAREESAFIRLAATGLRHAREEVLGPCCGADGKLRQRRAQSADGSGSRHKRVPTITQPQDIALEVRMRFWPAIKEHEQVRKERIKQRAVGLKQEVDEHRRKVMPLLTSPMPIKLFTGPQEEWFGVGRPLSVATGPALPSPTPSAQVPSVVVGLQTTAAPLSAQPQLTESHIALGAPPQVVPAQEDAAAAVGKPIPPASDPTLYNPNLTFHPEIRPGVPQFHKIWTHNLAKEVSMRKKRPPTTVPKPFALSPSAKDVIICGKRPTSSLSQPASKRTFSACARPVRHAKPSYDDGKKEENGGDDATSNAQPKVIPKGTRAHALRTEMVYCKYIKNMEKGFIPEEEQVRLKEIAKRRREVSKRLAQYIGDPRTEKEVAIRTKLKELRAVMKENEKSAQVRLTEMKERVAQIPPIFVEPTRLNNLAKARVEVEEEILKMLKQSGLDAGTICDIITRPVDNNSADNENVNEPAAEASMLIADGGAGSTPVDGTGKTGEDVAEPESGTRGPKTHDSSKSSLSSSLSSLTKKGNHSSNRSSSSSSHGAADSFKAKGAASPPQKQSTGYSDDSFEGFSSSSSA